MSFCQWCVKVTRNGLFVPYRTKSILSREANGTNLNPTLRPPLRHHHRRQPSSKQPSCSFSSLFRVYRLQEDWRERSRRAFGCRHVLKRKGHRQFACQPYIITNGTVKWTSSYRTGCLQYTTETKTHFSRWSMQRIKAPIMTMSTASKEAEPVRLFLLS